MAKRWRLELVTRNWCLTAGGQVPVAPFAHFAGAMPTGHPGQGGSNPYLDSPSTDVLADSDGSDGGGRDGQPVEARSATGTVMVDHVWKWEKVLTRIFPSIPITRCRATSPSRMVSSRRSSLRHLLLSRFYSRLQSPRHLCSEQCLLLCNPIGKVTCNA